MPEWLIEKGIGETRSVRTENGEIVEARILLDGVVAAGALLEAQLVDIGRDGRNAVAVADGQDYLLPEAPSGISQGARLDLEVVRETIPGAEPWKRPLAKLAGKGAAAASPVEGEHLPFPAPADRLGHLGWDDLIEEARSGIVRFGGGELRIFVTPAMTLIDVDGTLPPVELAMAGAKAAARAILRHGIGGSVGIDLPTMQGKEQRKAVGAAVDAILPNPFERTAVNGFGFLQIVRPRRHASLFELAADRPAFEARALLRQAAHETGALTLAAHPAVIAIFEGHPDWPEQLSRQVGGAVRLRSDPKLPMSGGHAEKA